jgi:hypothetical protein
MPARAIATLALVAALAGTAGCGSTHTDRPPPTVTTALAGGDPGTPAAPGLHATSVFQMPSGRYACGILDAAVVCDFRRQPGDKGNPTPNVAITATCRREAPDEWGNGVSLAARGKATPSCSIGANVTDTQPPKLAYGDRWTHAGYICRSATTGLTCTAHSGHGFFADKDTIRVH